MCVHRRFSKIRSHLVNGQQQVNYISMTTAWFRHLDTGTLIQHSGTGGFGNHNGLLILYSRFD